MSRAPAPFAATTFYAAPAMLPASAPMLPAATTQPGPGVIKPRVTPAAAGPTPAILAIVLSLAFLHNRSATVI